MRLSVVAFLSGLVFAVGLGLSGMTRADRIVGFLDVSGTWDPTLAFVMGGALCVMVVAQRLTGRIGRPVYASSFPVRSPSRIDARLVVGAAIFGVGWGLGGYCPGPGIVAIGAAALPAVVFGASMVVGMIIYNLALLPRFAATATPPSAEAVQESVTIDR